MINNTDVVQQRELLFSDLGLQENELHYIRKNGRHCRQARRFILLINEYLDRQDYSERLGIFQLIIEDVLPELKAAIQASELELPTGFALVSNQHLDALQAVAVKAISISPLSGNARYHGTAELQDLCDYVLNLDPKVENAVDSGTMRRNQS